MAEENRRLMAEVERLKPKIEVGGYEPRTEPPPWAIAIMIAVTAAAILFCVFVWAARADGEDALNRREQQGPILCYVVAQDDDARPLDELVFVGASKRT